MGGDASQPSETAQAVLAAFRNAYEHPEHIAQRLRGSGRRVARQLGTDVPRELLIAASILPVRLVELPPAPTPLADRAMGTAPSTQRSRSMLEQVLAEVNADMFVLSKAEARLPQLFAVLRELVSQGEAQLGPVHFVDLLHLPRASSRQYNTLRLQELRDRLGASEARPIDDAALSRAIAAVNEQKLWLSRAALLRTQGNVRLTGAQALQMIGSAAILPIEEHVELLQRLIQYSDALPPHSGCRIFLTGSNHESADFYALVESSGGLIIAEDHDWGDPWYAELLSQSGPPMDVLADPLVRTPLASRSLLSRSEALAKAVARTRPDVVIHVSIAGDEAAPWEVGETRRCCTNSRIPLLVLDLATADDSAHLRGTLCAFLSNPEGYAPVPAPASTPKSAPRRARGDIRSRKSLRSVAAFGDYQREWFADLRRRVAAGEPLAVVNANAPQEILRALDIPFVVNQWWAAIVAAKQQSGRYLNLLRDHGYPTDADAYSSQGLAAIFDEDREAAPWGGLPLPAFLHAINGNDGTAKLFEAWARESGADLYLFERTVDARWSIFQSWWEELPDRWHEVLESWRLDTLVDELREVIGTLERKTGRVFSNERFAAVMELVNEQEDYYRRTRDLIARTVPAPASIADTMPATMVPQWHRGTQWGRDAAKAFYEEVVQRVERGEAACANERVRLMWVGRGMWSEMGFYQRWEASHGAVFVWSMYLALAADGYIRTFDGGRDPLRALAARVLTMGDELRMPTWAAAWHVREAGTHGVHGAVALSDADPFVLRALERAGIPVLALTLDNFNQENADALAIESAVTEFIEGPVARYVAAGVMRKGT